MSCDIKTLEDFGFEQLATTRARFLNDDEFFFSMLAQFLDSDGIEELGSQLRAGDAKGAFDTAHMLKGVILNCGITPLYTLLDPIVESLRAQRDEPSALLPLYDKLVAKRDELKAVIS